LNSGGKVHFKKVQLHGLGALNRKPQKEKYFAEGIKGKSSGMFLGPAHPVSICLFFLVQASLSSG
jgi:hypothetical protein